MIDPTINPNVIEEETEDDFFPDEEDIFEGEKETDRPEGGIVPDIPEGDDLTEDERRPFSEEG